MHPEAPAPVRQRFHREAIVHFCRACVIYRHDRVMRQVHSHVSVEVRGRRCNYALSCCLQDEHSHPQSQHTGVALQSASLPAHFDSHLQAQHTGVALQSATLPAHFDSRPQAQDTGVALQSAPLPAHFDSRPQAQHTGVALQSAPLPAHFDSRPQAQHLGVALQSAPLPAHFDSRPQAQNTGVALQSAPLPAHFDSRPQAQNLLCNETSTILAGWARQGVRVQPVPDLATISGRPSASCLEALGGSEGCSKESSPPALVQISA